MDNVKQIQWCNYKVKPTISGEKQSLVIACDYLYSQNARLLLF